MLFAAVTVTVRVLSPETRSSSPAITTVAPTSVGSATTSTEVVPYGSWTIVPAVTSTPSTAKAPNEVSSFRATSTVTR